MSKTTYLQKYHFFYRRSENEPNNNSYIQRVELANKDFPFL